MIKENNMVTIIKQKGEGYVCLRTEMEKPSPTKSIGEFDHVYDSNFNQYVQSFKEYPIRKEDEDLFKDLASKEWINRDSSLLENRGAFNKCLSEGIEIDSKLIRIVENGGLSGQMEYAILVSPEEESNEDEKNQTIKFAEYLYMNYKLNPHKEVNLYKPKEWFTGDNFPHHDGFTIEKVYERFITRKNK